MADDDFLSGGLGDFGDFGGGDWGGGSSSGGGGLFGGSSKFDFGGIAKGVGGLIGGFQDSSAFKAEAASYETAAKIAEENVGLTEEEVALKQFNEDRKVARTIGTERSTIAGNGLAQGGSGDYIIEDSARQGALSKGLIGVEGQIQENAYRTQAEKARGEAAAATAAAGKAKTGGIMSGLGSVFSVASSLFGI